MHKNEFLNAFINKDAEKLKGFIFNKHRPDIILLTSLIGDRQEKLWVGDYLLLLAEERRDIPKECYAFIFQLKDQDGKSWPLYADEHRALMRLLVSLVDKGILSPDEALAISFYTPSPTSNNHLASRVVAKKRSSIPAHLVSWLHAAKDDYSRHAKAFLSLCLEKYCPVIDSHYHEMVGLLERFQANTELHELLQRFLFEFETEARWSERSLFADLYLRTINLPELENRLCIFIYHFIHANPPYLSALMGGFISKKNAKLPTDHLGDLLNLDQRQDSSSDGIVAVLEKHDPEWGGIVKEMSALCGNSFYPLLLLMIKKALIERGDEKGTERIISDWLKLMFDQSHHASHFPKISRCVKQSKRLSDFVFDMIGLCMKKGYDSLPYLFRSENNLLYLFSQIDPPSLKRLINLLLSLPNAEKYKKNIVNRCETHQISSESLNQYCVPLYVLFGADSYFLESFLKGFQFYRYLFSEGNRLSRLASSKSIPVTSSVVEMIEIEHPDWQGIIDIETCGLLYSVLLLMIRDTLKANVSPHVEEISKQWINALFHYTNELHIYSMETDVRNEHIWSLIFEIFELCDARGALKHLGFREQGGGAELGVGVIFQKWSVPHFKKFALLLLSSTTLGPYAKNSLICELLRLLSSTSTEWSVKLRSEEFQSFMLDTVLPLAMSDPTLRVFVIESFGFWQENPVCVKMVEKKLMELKFDSFSSEEQQAMRSSKNIVARYKIFKNDKTSARFSSVFPDWINLVCDINNPVRDHLLLEACLASAQLNMASGSVEFQRLMHSQDVLGLLVRFRHSFTIDQYRLLLKAACDMQMATKYSHFVMLSLDQEMTGLSDKLEELRKIYDCPVLVRLNNHIKIYGFYNGSWRLTQLNSEDFASLASKWGEPNVDVFVPAGDAMITEEMYQVIKATKGHDVHMKSADLLTELASIEAEQGHFEAARNCLNNIPSHRQCISSYIQAQLVAVCLKLYKNDSKLPDLFRALRYARILSESERVQYPVIEELLAQQETYFKQWGVLKCLFDWDEPLIKFDDDELYAVALTLRCVLLTKLQQDSTLEAGLIEHATRVFSWLTDHSIDTASLRNDFAAYKRGVPSKRWLLGWMSSQDELVAATEKLYQELLCVKAKNQFTEEIPEPTTMLTSSSGVTGLKK